MSYSLTGDTGWTGYDDSGYSDEGSWADESSFAEDTSFDDYSMSDDSSFDESYDDSGEIEEAFEEESYEEELEEESEEEYPEEEYEEEEEEQGPEEEQQKDEEEPRKSEDPEEKAPERRQREHNPFDAANKQFRDDNGIPKLPDFRQGKYITDPLGLDNGRENIDNDLQPHKPQPHYSGQQLPEGLTSDDPGDRVKAYQFAMNIPDAKIQSFSKSNPTFQAQVDVAADKLADYTAAFQNGYGLSNSKMEQLQNKQGWAKVVDNYIGEVSKTVTEAIHIMGYKDYTTEQWILDPGQPRGWFATVGYTVNSYHDLVDTYQKAFNKTEAEMAAVTAQPGWGTELQADMDPVWQQVSQYTRDNKDVWRSQVDQYLETHTGWGLNTQAALQEFAAEEASGAYPKPVFDPNPPPEPIEEVHWTAPSLVNLETAAQSAPSNPTPQPPPESQPQVQAQEETPVPTPEPIHVEAPDLPEDRVHTADEDHPTARAMSASDDSESSVLAEATPESTTISETASVYSSPTVITSEPPPTPYSSPTPEPPYAASYQYDEMTGVMAAAQEEPPQLHAVVQEWSVQSPPEELPQVSEVYREPVTETPAQEPTPEPIHQESAQDIEPEPDLPRFRHYGGKWGGGWDGGGHNQY
jgi:hypothetical protein